MPGHLLEIAYTFGGRRAPALAVSMARPRQLEGRMLAALDAARNRRVPGVRVRAAWPAVAAALLLPLAGATATVVAGRSRRRVGSIGGMRQASAPPQHEDALAPALKTCGVSRLAASAGATSVVRRGACGIAQESAARHVGDPSDRDAKAPSTCGWSELNSSSGTNVPIERLEGLTAAQLTGAGGPVQFRLRRDAGTFTFEGVVRNGVGAGTFSFTPDPNFPAELAKRGFARPTAREQYQMARHDIGFAFVDELNKQGYAKPQTSELVRAGQHGVQRRPICARWARSATGSARSSR